MNSLDNVSAEEWKIAKTLMVNRLLDEKASKKIKRGIYDDANSNKSLELCHSFMMIGEKIYAFSTGKVLATGGYGKVKLVKDEQNNIYALKIVPENKVEINLTDAEEGFLIDYGIQQGSAKNKKKHYYLMNYLGEDLDKYLSKNCPNKKERLDLLLKCAIEIKKLHTGESAKSKKPRIHFDIKEANFVVDPKTKNVKLIDFGFTKSFSTDPQKLIKGDLGGTSYYLPGEFYLALHNPKERTQLTPALDVYSFGIILRDLAKEDKQLRRLAQAMTNNDDKNKRPTIHEVEMILRLISGSWNEGDLKASETVTYTEEQAKAKAMFIYYGNAAAYEPVKNLLLTQTLACAYDYLNQYKNKVFTHGKKVTEKLIIELIENPGLSDNMIKDKVKKCIEAREVYSVWYGGKSSQNKYGSRASFFKDIINDTEGSCQNSSTKTCSDGLTIFSTEFK